MYVSMNWNCLITNILQNIFIQVCKGNRVNYENILFFGGMNYMHTTNMQIQIQIQRETKY